MPSTINLTKNLQLKRSEVLDKTHYHHHFVKLVEYTTAFQILPFIPVDKCSCQNSLENFHFCNKQRLLQGPQLVKICRISEYRVSIITQVNIMTE